MSKTTCNWHNPDKSGKCSHVRFEHPDGKQAINMYFSGAQITFRMELEGSEFAQMSFPINYCPMCGEKIRREAEQ